MLERTISHYKLLEKLGEGGMGVVYKAEDSKLNRFVALKFLSPQVLGAEKEKTRFIHEAQAAAALSYPNICTVYEIDEYEGQTFIAMEYIEGASLKDNIASGPLNLGDALDIAIQVAEGIQEAHEKNIIHRDIKSANVMISEKGQAKILDFGLAKLAGRTKVTKTGMTMGTVSYMSPEQSEGAKVDHRTDIWSFGVMLYEMVTGQLPFSGEYDQATVFSIMNEEPEPITGLRTGVPMELERIVNKCLSKSTEERYQHADEMAADLNKLYRALNISDKVHGSRVTKKEPLKKKSNKIFLSVGVLLSVCIIALAIIFLPEYFYTPPQPETEIGTVTGWENSIAVLPFDNISADPEQDYFCDGMTEQIISNLAKLSRLKVISRTSVMKYKRTDKTIPEIGKELNVAHILEGSVRKFGDRIRVTAQLISTKDDFHLWAENYDKEYKDFFELQDEVSQTIAGNLLRELSGEEKQTIRSSRPVNLEAYEYYLKGRQLIYSPPVDLPARERLKMAEGLLKKAIKLDPEFADAYASLADVYNTFYNWSDRLDMGDEKKEKYWFLQEAYLDTALKLNPNSAEAYHVRHFLNGSKAEKFKKAGDYKKYETALDAQYNDLITAIKLNAGHSLAYDMLGRFLEERGLITSSFHYINKSIELDPLQDRFYLFRGYNYELIGKYAEAEADYQKALQLNPNYVWNLRRYMRILLKRNRYEEAEKILLKHESISPDWKNTKSMRAVWHLLRGEKNKVIGKDIVKYDRFVSDLILKNGEAVLVYLSEDLERKKNNKASDYIPLKSDPLYDFIRTDPIFQELLAQHKKVYEENLLKYQYMRWNQDIR